MPSSLALSFLMDLYRPEARFNTPTGGSVLIPLNGVWVDGSNVPYGVTLSVSDEQSVNFGTTLPSFVESQAGGNYGSLISAYSRPDREISVRVNIDGGGVIANMQKAVQTIQATIAEGTEFAINQGLGYGGTMGRPLMLRYRPDSTVSPVYYCVKGGVLNLENYNEQVSILEAYCYIDITLRVSYAAYGDGVYLCNLIPNGTFGYGFLHWTGTTAYTGGVTSNGNWYACYQNGGTEYVMTSANHENGTDRLWSSIAYPGDTWSYARYATTGVAGTETLTSREFPLTNNSSAASSSLVVRDQSLWLDLEAKTYGAYAPTVGKIEVRLEVFISGNSTWTQFGPSLYISGSSTAWKRWSWGSAQSMLGSASTISKGRLKIIIDKSDPAGSTIAFRKIAVWHFPQDIGSAFVKLPATEYVSQTFSQQEGCYLTGVRGTLETNCRIKLSNVKTDPANTAYVLQQAHIGARKVIEEPFNYFNKYGLASVNISAGVDYSGGADYRTYNLPNGASYPDTKIQVGAPDMRPRQYRVVLRIATNSIIGAGLGNTNSATFASQRPSMTLVPNGSVSEIPNTGGSYQVVDCGVVTLPPYNAQNTGSGFLGGGIPGSGALGLTFFATRLANSTSGAITASIDYMWLIPVDEYNYVDTRNQDNLSAYDVTSWSNYINTSDSVASPITNIKQLVIDGLFKDFPTYYIGNHLEVDSLTSFLNPVATNNNMMLYPATVYSPEPMAFYTLARRAGSSGNPATDITLTDPVMYTFLYCPAYEF